MSPRALVLALTCLAACHHDPAVVMPRPAPHPAPAEAPAVAAALDAGAVADEGPAEPPPSPAPGPWATAWTDPAAVAGLATSCTFRPPPPDTDDGDPLECATGIEEQSCTYDPCHETVDLPCRRVCGRSCTGCDARCRGACGRCRAACHDDACVLACATSCGRCLQTCVTDRDRCLSAGCAVRYATCYRRAVEHFRRGPCLAACTRCQASCEGGENHQDCLARCTGRACTAEEVNHCSWAGPNFGVEESDEGADAGAP